MEIGGHYTKKMVLNGDINNSTANVIQYFASSPRSSTFTIKHLEIDKILKWNYKQKMFIHAPYVYNPAISDDSVVQGFLKQLLWAENTNTYGLIFHTGKTSKKEEGIKNMRDLMSLLCTKTSSTYIIFETPAGQGKEIVITLPEIYELTKDVKNFHTKGGICIDTCHSFAAGELNPNDKEKFNNYLYNLEYLIKYRVIKCIHFNDSVKGFGSMVDRHENIGQGKIGMKGMKLIANFAFEQKIPLILETPVGKDMYEDEYSLIRSFKG